MVKVKAKTLENHVILDCSKPDGLQFRLVVDTNTLDLLEKPEYPDIDASVVYSRVYRLLSAGKPIPKCFSAEWG